MTPLSESAILEKLSRIIDPDFNRDIVSLGFVRNISIDEGKVGFDIALTTPACPLKTEFQKQAEDLVKTIPGVQTVTVNMTTLPRKTTRTPDQQDTGLSRVKSIIAVSSCKGGVGKSTLAAYLALSLAQRGFRTGLADADIYGPSVPTLFGIHDEELTVNEQRRIIPLDVHGLKLMSFGFLLGDAPAVMRGPMVSQYVQQVLHACEWGDLDYLFIDMPPGTGDIQLTITQTVRLSGAVIVTTPQTLSLIDVARGILMFEKVNVPMLGIIENMAYFECDGCQKQHFIFGNSQDTDLFDRFGLETLARIPLMPSLTRHLSGDTTNPQISTAVDRMVRALGKRSIEDLTPPKVEFDEKQVRLTWADGKTLVLENKRVRLSCRCAVCVDEFSGKQILKEDQVSDAVAPVRITPLGNYALGIEWNDGHASGIYPYQTLQAIAQ